VGLGASTMGLLEARRAMSDIVSTQALQRTLAWAPDFWAGRRVLVTGHTGFKGAWLVAWLADLGARVTGFSLPGAHGESQIWQLIGPLLVAGGLTDLRGDLRQRADLDAAIAQAQPDIVLHLAAQAIVLDSYVEPEATWETNVLGTLYLLQALGARSSRDPVVVVCVTSDKCYENRDWPWGYRETDALGGADPYSASKAACEILLASWRRSFGQLSHVRVASARAGNVIGGGDAARHRIVPDLLQAFTAGRSAVVRNPTSVRPYQHVLDPLAGYLLLARRLYEKGEPFEQAYNFGPDANGVLRTGDLAWMVAQCWGGDARIETLSPGATSVHHEASTLLLDSAKARQELGWFPHWNAVQAVEVTVAWHKASLHDAAHAIEATRRQIEDYMVAGANNNFEPSHLI
jgi:CDP-glucose 4,6-dehydratase